MTQNALVLSIAGALSRCRERRTEVPETGPCGAPYLPVDGPLADGVTYCDFEWHYDLTGVTGRCTDVRRREIQKRVASERQRLTAEIARIEQRSRFGFAGYDPSLCEGGARALAVMQRFGVELAFNAVLIGSAGLGKSHLLLASHFACLERGVSSVYLRTPELRRWFRARESFDSEVSAEAERNLSPALYAQAVHFDDAGHIENDQRARGQFAEGLKDLLDRSRGRWAVATNRAAEEAERHPDLSGVVVSRFLLDAEVVRLDGADYRVMTARTE
jgi:DNA replication protein DnaC